MGAIRRVAVVGAGPAGAITIDALAKEHAFDTIRVFERREAPGGCWLDDNEAPPLLSDFNGLSQRSADAPVPVPSKLPAQTPKVEQLRFAESSIYPYLETNVESLAMEFSQEPIPETRTDRSIALHGADTPFRHWSVIKGYIQDLVKRNGYEDYVEYNTFVESVEKVGHEWKVVLRKVGGTTDYWWSEWFDAVIVASGHYSVPYVPHIEGLEAFEKMRPGSVIHSKHFRGKDYYDGKRVVVVGASVSAADIAFDLARDGKASVYAVVEGHRTNIYFGGEAFNHPNISKRPSVTRVAGRTVYFADNTQVDNVDHIIFGTGFSWTLPFLPSLEIRNNRVVHLYQHVVYRHDPSLLFVGAVGAGLTFKIFEWQAVYAARLLSGRAALPALEEMEKWEQERIARAGDGAGFILVFPEFEEYFEKLRELAGAGNGRGRELPVFDRKWFKSFMDGHERRKAMWTELNGFAREESETSPNRSGMDGAE